MKVCFRRQTLLAMAVLLVLSIGTWAAEDASKPIEFSALAERHGAGVIDWGTEMLYATGEGAMPTPQEEPNRARARLKATDYAKMDAISNLLMLIEGTSISYEATGKDYMADASVRQLIEGYVKNVEVLREEKVTEDGAGIIRVTVGTRMYGSQAPGAALLLKMGEVRQEKSMPTPVKVEIPATPPKPVEVKPEEPGPAKVKPGTPKPVAPKPVDVKTVAEKPKSPPKAVAARPKTETPKSVVVKTETKVAIARAEPKPQPKAVTKAEPKVEPEPQPGPAEASKSVAAKEIVAETKPAVAPESPVATGGPYTSVIIDTLGLKVIRAMSPKIRTPDGAEVWGTLRMDPDEVQDHGPVAYARSVEDARQCSRAGSNPLLLKAIGRAGGSRMCDVVLSDADVARLKQADQDAKPPFLAQLKVVFVVDPVKAF